MTETKSNVISKAFNVIRAFTDLQSEWGVNELARHLETPVSTMHRMLKILREEGILSFSKETKKYTIGNELLRISTIVTSTVSINEIAQEHLKPITETFDRSVYLALYHKESKMLSFTTRVNSTNAFRYYLELGTKHPLTIAASGKIILANLNEEEQQQAINKGNLEKGQISKLSKELANLKQQGYAITQNERKIGALGISTPVFDASKEVVASMTCIIPVDSFLEEESGEIIEMMRKQAKSLSKALGGQ